MKKKEIKSGHSTIYVPKTSEVHKIKPLNWLSKILLKFCKLKIIHEIILNPIYAALNKETEVYGSLPKFLWKESGWKVKNAKKTNTKRT